MMFTSSVTFAEYSFPAYISDLKLIGGTEAETAQLLKKYKSEGWTCTEYDLNYGCKSGADRIYLLYKSTVFASTNGGFVTGNSFTMPAENVVVSASLVQKKFAVKLGGNDLTRGSVTGDGEYVYGSTVTVTATAKDGYVFVGWMDENQNIVSTEASYRFTATDNQRLTAVFKVDESTGIKTVNAQSDEDVWYTLNGHKLAGKPIQKGVYIHNNKKDIIK